MADLINQVLESVTGEGKKAHADEQVLEHVRRQVEALTVRYPLYTARQTTGA